MTDLVSRLRMRKVRNSPAGARLCDTFVNPDGPEAADEITRLAAEVERFREGIKAFLPKHICLANPSVSDAAIIPLEATMGELRHLATLQETKHD